MKMNLPSYVLDLIGRLEENGYECYVVGGAVRSFLLHLPIHDYDLTTDATPAEMQAVFHDFKTIETGLRHGTLTVISGSHPIEITTYRHDAGYADHRHPEAVIFSRAVEEDCARRDFTVNALCYNPAVGILDFFGGINDINDRILRCIGIPENRFDEDALRILRALRFAAQLNFVIDPATKAALLQCRHLLRYVSMERIHEELDGFFSAAVCAPYMQEYRLVFAGCIPKGESISDEEWQDVFRIIDRTAKPLLRMALFLSCCESLDPAETLNDMKYANVEKRQILNMLAYRDAPLKTHTDVRRLLRCLQTPFADYLAFRKALDPALDEAALAAEYEAILRRHECWQLKDMNISGTDIRELGFSGKEIAEVLEYLLDEIINDRIINRKNALLAAAEQYKKDHES